MTRWYTYLALVCAIWFALTSWMWIYLMNIIFSYPVGIAALGIWWFTRKKNPENKVNRAIFWLLIAGWISSILAMFLFK